MRLAAAIGLDLVMVLVFAVIGRSSHGEADNAAGIIATAWPYLCAAVLGWLITLGSGRGRTMRKPYGLRTGLIVWVTTVALGMVLRLLAGGTAAWQFWIVAFISLGVLVLGWRLVARGIAQLAAAMTSSDASKLE